MRDVPSRAACPDARRPVPRPPKAKLMAQAARGVPGLLLLLLGLALQPAPRPVADALPVRSGTARVDQHLSFQAGTFDESDRFVRPPSPLPALLAREHAPGHGSGPAAHDVQASAVPAHPVHLRRAASTAAPQAPRSAPRPLYRVHRALLI